MTGKFRSALIGLAILAAATAASAQELAITSGGRRIIDRDPSTAATNCLGWSYGASPILDESGNVTSVYTVSDQLAHHCDVGVESDERFGDTLQLHRLDDSGRWSRGVDVVDRSSFSWMHDSAFIAAHPESYIGHVSSPSVVHADGRWYMAFVASVNDRNLCAAEHATDNHCGSCRDPWSYFVVMWAVSDDGVHWRVRERGPGDATLIGRAPDLADRSGTTEFKGLARVALVPRDEGGHRYFYIGAQYWSANFIKPMMFRVERDPQSEFGIMDTPQVWSFSNHAWLDCMSGRVPDLFSSRDQYSLVNFSFAMSSIAPTTMFGYDGYIAVGTADTWLSPTEFHHSNSVVYATSHDLLTWTPAVYLRSALRDFADGFGYDVSVIDPVVVDRGNGKLSLYFSSADGDPDFGIERDGKYDCVLDPNIGATATYVGIGVYESTVEWVTLRPTTLVVTPQRSEVVAGSRVRFEVRVTADDGSIPEGLVTVVTFGNFQQVRLRDGRATVELLMTLAGDQQVWAYFESRGIWQYANASGIVEKVVEAQPRRRTARH